MDRSLARIRALCGKNTKHYLTTTSLQHIAPTSYFASCSPTTLQRSRYAIHHGFRRDLARSDLLGNTSRQGLLLHIVLDSMRDTEQYQVAV